MAKRVLDVDGIKAALVLLPALDHPDAASVPAARQHHEVADFELDEIHDLVGLQVNLDGVIGFDERVRVADRATIVGVQARNAILSTLHRPNLAELELQTEYSLNKKGVIKLKNDHIDPENKIVLILPKNYFNFRKSKQKTA